MRTLYPEIEPYNRFNLQVDSVHCLYIEETGNPSGMPVVFVHGGPGVGSNENHRRYFNPDHYRIINFDQRGCNRSVPAGEIRSNTTQDLISDMEQIRSMLHINRWLIFGGSWGATLGLLYAQVYPDHVIGLILRGTFLARQSELDWFVKHGANRIFPDAWARFINHVPVAERDDPISAYFKRIQDADAQVRLAASRHWSNWSAAVVGYLLPQDGIDSNDTPDKLISHVAIELHYAKHGYFIAENQILNNTDKIPDLPVILIHGRRDLTCTLDASWALHRAISGSELVIVREGGHLAGEPVMTDALVGATDQFAEK